MKIYIVGCAKSGTWLLLWLFYGFENIHIIDYMEERPISHLQERRLENEKIGVWKRSWNMIFSHKRDTLSPSLERQLEIIQEEDIKIVYIKRNKEDVLKSDGGWVDEERYDDCEKQASEFAEHINCVVDYDVLLRNPNETQLHVKDCLGLQILHKWSDFPDFVPDDVFKIHEGKPNYSKRRIGGDY